MNLKLPFLALLIGASSLVFACDADFVTYDSGANDNGSNVVTIDDYAQPTSFSVQDPASLEQPLPTAYHRGAGANTTSLSGRVVDVRTVPVEGADVDHLIGTVQTDTGRTFVVDLGTTQTLKEHSLNIGAGDPIAVQGNAGMFNGNSMIVADRINNTSLQFANDRDVASADALETNASGELPERIGIRQRTVSGKIQDLREVPIEGQAESHMMAKIETFKGHTAIVDLGPKAQLPNVVALKPGVEIAAFGTVGRLNGLPLVIAEKVAEIKDIPGREVQPNKAGSFEPAPSAQPSAAQPQTNAAPPADNDEPPASEAMEHAR